jgi:hypothetical protein
VIDSEIRSGFESTMGLMTEVLVYQLEAKALLEVLAAKVDGLRRDVDTMSGLIPEGGVHTALVSQVIDLQTHVRALQDSIGHWSPTLVPAEELPARLSRWDRALLYVALGLGSVSLLWQASRYVFP